MIARDKVRDVIVIIIHKSLIKKREMAREGKEICMAVNAGSNYIEKRT